MARQILIELALFLVPFAVYALLLAGRRRDPRSAEAWRDAPLAWMTVGGLVLVAAGLAALALLNDEASESGRYVPARIENGVLLPGHFDR